MPPGLTLRCSHIVGHLDYEQIVIEAFGVSAGYWTPNKKIVSSRV